MDHVSNLERENFDMDDNYVHVDCYITSTFTEIFKVVYLIYPIFFFAQKFAKTRENVKKIVGVILSDLKIILWQTLLKIFFMRIEYFAL